MLSWLVDNSGSVYLLLAVLALVWLFVVWLQRQKDPEMEQRAVLLRTVAGLGIIVLLAVMLGLLTLFIPTDQKQITEKLKEMSAGVKARDTNRIFAHVSEEFRLGSLDKAAFRSHTDRIIQSGYVEEVEMWDFKPIQVERTAGGKQTATILFSVKPKGQFGSEAFYQCKAVFVRDPEGWRLQTFNIYDPLRNPDTPLTIPTLPQ